jgi:shikimate dehydrogenase
MPRNSLLTISGFSAEAKKACVIGSPVSHSLSPMIHNYWLDKYSIDGVYHAVETSADNLGDLLDMLPKMGYVGANITVPYKEKSLQHLLSIGADIPQEAQKIGAINTIHYQGGGKIFATNTDGAGFMQNLQANGVSVDGKNIALIGAGGTARSVLHAVIQQKPASINIYNRTISKAENLQKLFLPDCSVVVAPLAEEAINPESKPKPKPEHKLKHKPKLKIFATAELKHQIKDYDIIINTTSLGMDGKSCFNIDYAKAKTGAVFADVIYLKNGKTALLHQAEVAGFKAIDGLGMLICQAKGGFELWFNKMPAKTEDKPLKNILTSC